MKTDFDLRLPPALFAPGLILEALRRYEAEQGPGSIRQNQRAKELFTGAVTILGMQELMGRQFHLGLPDDDPPDYYAAEPPRPGHPGYFTVENKSITNWNREETDGFTPAGLATRIRNLIHPYAHDPLLTFVVHLNYDMDEPLKHRDLHEALVAELADLKVTSAIWIVGQNQDDSWMVHYVYPKLGHYMAKFQLPAPSAFDPHEVDLARSMLAAKVERTSS